MKRASKESAVTRAERVEKFVDGRIGYCEQQISRMMAEKQLRVVSDEADLGAEFVGDDCACFSANRGVY